MVELRRPWVEATVATLSASISAATDEGGDKSNKISSLHELGKLIDVSGKAKCLRNLKRFRIGERVEFEPGYLNFSTEDVRADVANTFELF